MPLDPQVYLHDISKAAASLQRFTTGRTLEQYLADEILQAAVERKFEILGEAVAQLTKAAPEVAVKIPDRSRIVAFRNILIHAYAQVKPATVWDILQNDLPKLIESIKALLPTGKP